MIATLAESWDVIVIGSGPAGMAAATVTTAAGLATLVLDEQSHPGGQIHRAITASPFAVGRVLGADYWSGAALVQSFRASGAHHLPDAIVWNLTRDREIGVTVAGMSRSLHAAHVIVATGALERPIPIPGWTLPGVMTVGAAQTLLKTSALVTDGPTVLAGTGPLLWLLAAQYLAVGARIDLILDTTPSGNRRAAQPHLVDFLRSPYLLKGLGLLLKVRRQVSVIDGVTALAATGDGRVESVPGLQGPG